MYVQITLLQIKFKIAPFVNFITFWEGNDLFRTAPMQAGETNT